MKKICVAIVLLFVVGCAPLPSQQPAAKYDFEQRIDGQMDSLAKQIVRQLRSRRIRRVVVKSFSDIDGKAGNLEKYLDIELTDRLHRTGLFSIIEKETLEKYDEDKPAELVGDAISEELKIEREDVKKLGRVLQVDSILVGNTVDLANSVKISVKLISTRTGAIFGTASLLLKKDSTVNELVSEKNIGVTTDPSGGNRFGVFIQAVENQYCDLIPDKYTLYVRRVNYELNPYADTESNVEVFLNDELKVLQLDEMLSFTFDEEKYVLTLKNISRHAAVFAFAKLKSSGS